MVRCMRWMCGALVIAAVGCAPAPAPRWDAVRITRGACEGPCPSYTVRLERDGAFAYSGPSRVQAGRIAPPTLDTVSEAMTPLALADWQPGYEARMDACLNSRLDLSNTHVEIRVGGRVRRLSYNAYCMRNPGADEVARLADAIDAAVRTSRWQRPGAALARTGG